MSLSSTELSSQQLATKAVLTMIGAATAGGTSSSWVTNLSEEEGQGRRGLTTQPHSDWPSREAFLENERSPRQVIFQLQASFYSFHTYPLAWLQGYYVECNEGNMYLGLALNCYIKLAGYAANKEKSGATVSWIGRPFWQ